MAFPPTASGATPAGADRLSGVPLESDRLAVEVSRLALPRMKVPPVAASAKPAPLTTRARVTAITVAGLSDRSTPRQRRPPGSGTAAAIFDVHRLSPRGAW